MSKLITTLILSAFTMFAFNAQAASHAAAAPAKNAAAPMKAPGDAKMKKAKKAKKAKMMKKEAAK